MSDLRIDFFGGLFSDSDYEKKTFDLRKMVPVLRATSDCYLSIQREFPVGATIIDSVNADMSTCDYMIGIKLVANSDFTVITLQDTGGNTVVHRACEYFFFSGVDPAGGMNVNPDTSPQEWIFYWFGTNDGT